MPENSPASQPEKQESTFERLKKRIFTVNVSLWEFFLLLSFLVGVSVTIVFTYRTMDARLKQIESEITKQSNEYKTATDNMQKLLEQYDKRLDQMQQEVNLLRK